MAYIGNARSLIIIGSNVRDDLIPGYEEGTTSGPFNKTAFPLSQEVPGGHEGNVTVLRQKFIIDELVADVAGNKLTFTSDETTCTIACADPTIASVLAVLRPNESSLKIGVETSRTVDLPSVSPYLVTAVVFDGEEIAITLNAPLTYTSNSSDTITLSHCFVGPWEVLDPENDYNIEGIGDNTNKVIRLEQAPQIDDKVYVVHRGEATYNFAPSPNSVGPAQLSENLRSFRIDKLDLDSSLAVVDVVLTQEVVAASSLLVTVNGRVVEPIVDASAPSDAWSLTTTAAGDQVVRFEGTGRPVANDKIRVRHLGFSTVARRATFSPGQAQGVPGNSIGESELKAGAVVAAKIAANAVINTKIAANAVDGTKLRLQNNEAIRALKADGTTQSELLKLDVSNKTQLIGESVVAVNIAGAEAVSIGSTEILPTVSGAVSIGSVANKFKDAHLSGNVAVGGNVTVTGTVDGVDVSALKALVDQLIQKISAGSLAPVGSIMLWTSNAMPDGLPDTESITPSDWKVCDGRALNTYDWRELHARISNTFGGTAFASGTTDVLGATTTFNLPDLQKRAPVGQNTFFALGASDALPVASRTVQHQHNESVHAHGLANHTHSIPAHKHRLFSDIRMSGLVTNGSVMVSGLTDRHGTGVTAADLSEGQVVEIYSDANMTTSVGTSSIQTVIAAANSVTLNNVMSGFTGTVTRYFKFTESASKRTSIAILNSGPHETSLIHSHRRADGTTAGSDNLRTGNPKQLVGTAYRDTTLTHHHAIPEHSHTLGSAGYALLASTASYLWRQEAPATTWTTNLRVNATQAGSNTSSGNLSTGIALGGRTNNFATFNTNISSNVSNVARTTEERNCTVNVAAGISPTNELIHVHEFSLTSGTVAVGDTLANTNSTSTGTHSHNQDSFTTGIIGAKNAPSGDAALTSGAAVGSTDTSSGNITAPASSPYLAINFIIRAKSTPFGT